MSRIALSVAFLLAFGCLGAAPLQGAEPTVKAFGEPISLFDGKSLAGWEVANANDFARHGKVDVHDGAIRMGAGSQGTGIRCTHKELPRSNYEVRLEAMRSEGSDFFCGLTFPVGESYVTFIVGGWGGGVTGLSNIDDLTADENETTDYVDFESNRWYKIRVQVTDDSIRCWIDGELKADVARAERRFTIWWEQEPLRPLGISTWNTAARLRKIELLPPTKL